MSAYLNVNYSDLFRQSESFICDCVMFVMLSAIQAQTPPMQPQHGSHTLQPTALTCQSQCAMTNQEGPSLPFVPDILWSFQTRRADSHSDKLCECVSVCGDQGAAVFLATHSNTLITTPLLRISLPLPTYFSPFLHINTHIDTQTPIMLAKCSWLDQFYLLPYYLPLYLFI